jgi:hypothetical protein
MDEDYGEIRIEVMVPGSRTGNGHPRKLTLSQKLPADRIRIPVWCLPAAMERAARALLISMRFR